jgi:hypothetical protein
MGRSYIRYRQDLADTEDNQVMNRDKVDTAIIAHNAKRGRTRGPVTSQDTHEELFADRKLQPPTLEELKEGIRAHIRKRHALNRHERLRQ